MKKDEVDKNPTKPLFPTPPMRPSEVQFRVRRLIWLQAHFLAEYGEEDVTSLGGLETATSVSASGAPVDVQTKEKVFIPSERDKSTGTWMQETMFRSAYLLTCPPTFQTPTMRIKYNLFLKVVFPGLGNSIAYEIPINITSGLSAAPPSYDSSDHPPPLLSVKIVCPGSVEDDIRHSLYSGLKGQRNRVTSQPGDLVFRQHGFNMACDDVFRERML
ncbi:hypothetical protein EUX98_g3290 [Antrodiella citrinella]|uniref:Arrestin-like N-terminal domain-containing protein n=1 Tax=Antrodiella citrinella TaxID=2447956 RepID=A0A4S4MZ27_9APHY|nr:hypothetical protein EUX98_g3290 [Antrodiella citrinella]